MGGGVPGAYGEDALKDGSRDNGLNNVKDGLKLNSNKQGDQAGIKGGLRDATANSDSIAKAIELVNTGNRAEARKVITDAMSSLENSSEIIKM